MLLSLGLMKVLKIEIRSKLMIIARLDRDKRGRSELDWIARLV